VIRARFVARSAIVVFALGVAACGGGGDDSRSVEQSIKEAVEQGNIDQGNVKDAKDGGTKDLPDPCRLVTRDDAARLFGEAARTTDEQSPVALGASCVYADSAGDRLGEVGHLLRVRVFDGEQFFGADTFDDERTVAGLGDRAFVRSGDGALAGVDVQFVKDGETVTLGYSTVNNGVDNDADKVRAGERADEVVALARQAAERM
jgi:hypothetical protein